jgi:hypothetical protein
VAGREDSSSHWEASCPQPFLDSSKPHCAFHSLEEMAFAEDILEAVPDSRAFQAAFVAAVRDTGDAVADASFVGSCLAVQAAASLLAARDVDAVGDIDTVAS